MCLSSKREYPYTAKQDLICYKVMSKSEGKYHAIYFPYTYKFNERNYPLKYLNGLPSYDYILNMFEVGCGFLHAFETLALARSRITFRRRDPYCNIQAQDVIVKCIIPKGSIYYRDAYFDEIATNCLIPIEEISW